MLYMLIFFILSKESQPREWIPIITHDDIQWCSQDRVSRTWSPTVGGRQSGKHCRPQLGKIEVLRGLRNFLYMDRPEHHGTDRLKERGAAGVCWLLNVPATCQCISWTNFLLLLQSLSFLLVFLLLLLFFCLKKMFDP